HGLLDEQPDDEGHTQQRDADPREQARETLLCVETEDDYHADDGDLKEQWVNRVRRDGVHPRGCPVLRLDQAGAEVLGQVVGVRDEVRVVAPSVELRDQQTTDERAQEADGRSGVPQRGGLLPTQVRQGFTDSRRRPVTTEETGTEDE